MNLLQIEKIGLKNKCKLEKMSFPCRFLNCNLGYINNNNNIYIKECELTSRQRDGNKKKTEMNVCLIAFYLQELQAKKTK